jgi:molecular chaperone HtpG
LLSGNKFQLNLPGLLKVLAEHLYSTRRVAVRELIQNAHDSTFRRQVEASPASYQPRIDLHTDPETLSLSIRDNGAGMTEQEIADYLSTIGSSYTRDLGQKLSVLSPEEASALIGQFGLGFLSAFLIAEEVTLVTRSYQSEHAYRWHSDGSEYFDLSPTEADDVGTMVHIKLKPEAQFLLEESVLIDTVRKYADFLSVPIYVNDDPAPANLMLPPWKADNPEQAIGTFIDRVFHTRDVIAVIPLHDQTVDLGHDTLVIPLKGFLFIPSSSVVSLREYGDLRIYIRGMFITEEDRRLMPRWARFCRGLIDCPLLQPTASREDIHQEDNYVAVQQAIETQLLAALRQIAREDPETWRRIVLGHTDLVLGWIVANDEFFEQVADSILLRTTRGLMSMPDYLQQSKGVLYFVTREIGSLQEQLLGEGYEVPVIDSSWFAVRSFLEKYAAWHPGTRMVQMDGDARQLLRPVPEDQYTDLLKYYRKRGLPVKVAAFKPVTVPALVMYPRNAEALNNVRRALDSGEITGSFQAMFNDYMSQQQDQDIEESTKGALYLNASSPLIQKLASDPPPDTELVLGMLYQIARLFAARSLTPADASAAFDEITTSLQGMMNNE